MQVRKQQLELDMEQQTGSKWEKQYVKAVYCHPAYLTYMQSHEIKRRLLLGRKVMTNLDSIFKSRHYFANKGPSSQGYGFSCGHV